MTTDKAITLSQECKAVLVPSGEAVVLPAGSRVWVTQALGGSYTVMTDHGHVARVDGDVGERLGFPPAGAGAEPNDPSIAGNSPLEKQVWAKLRTCFDPEIPVNIVDLGLIYDCRLEPIPQGGSRAVVRFTLTAQGCGMGEFLRADIRAKLLSIPEIKEAVVDLVWDPPWNQGRISESAKHALGIE